MIAKLDMLCEQALIHIVLTCYLHVQVCVLIGLPDISYTYLPTRRNKNKSTFLRNKNFSIFISREEIVDLQKGDQHIMRYKPLSGLVMSGAVSLI